MRKEQIGMLVILAIILIAVGIGFYYLAIWADSYTKTLIDYSCEETRQALIDGTCLSSDFLECFSIEKIKISYDLRCKGEELK